MEIILFGIGFVLLIKGADYLVEGSSALARKLGVSALIIGLTVVALGTSMPEMVVNIMAAISGSGDIAFGNIIGSNMSNILLILGVSSIIANLDIKRSTIWKEIPFACLAVIVLLLLANIPSLDNLPINYLLRTEGIILILFFVIFLLYIFGLAKENKFKVEGEKPEIKKYSSRIIFLMIASGLTAMYFGGNWIVGGAVYLARKFGLSEFFISATIIAVGTSLPELITAVVAVRKKNMDLAVGNVVGSNIFNIFWILGITSVIRPIKFPDFANVDLTILLLTTVLLFLFMFMGKRHELKRWQGMIFIVLYAVYVVSLFFRG